MIRSINHLLTPMFLAVVFLFSLQHVYGNNEMTDEKIIEAFQNNPKISEKLMSYEDAGFEDGGIEILLIDENCKKNACSQGHLVIQSYIKETNNTKLHSVLGLVNVSHLGEIMKVTYIRIPRTAFEAQTVRRAKPIEKAKAVNKAEPLKLKKNSVRKIHPKKVVPLTPSDEEPRIIKKRLK